MDGLLNFKYSNRFSRSREEFLLNHIERNLMTEVLRTKVITETIFATLNPKTLAERAANTSRDYSQMTLPYLGQKGTLDTKSIDKAEIGAIKKRLEEARKRALETKGK